MLADLSNNVFFMNTFKCLLTEDTIHTNLVIINSYLNYCVDRNSPLKERCSEWCFSVPTWPQILRMPYTSISTSKQSLYIFGYADLFLFAKQQFWTLLKECFSMHRDTKCSIITMNKLKHRHHQPHTIVMWLVTKHDWMG